MLTEVGPHCLESMASYCRQIEKKIEESVAAWGEKTKLRDACHYALTNGGKRFRPLIVLFIAESLGLHWDAYPAALAVEFFHTASLIADDLPCMDNDDERRNKPSLHKVYGESVALLASYALITAAFQKIHENAAIVQALVPEYPHVGAQAGMLALESAAHCAGILGATGGQFFDLYPPDHRLDTVKRVIYQKTVTLFEVSFVLGWVFGGGDIGQLDQVKKAALYFGMAFQTADDLDDMAQDAQKERKISMGQFLGQEQALVYFDEQTGHLVAALEALGLFTPPFQYLCQQMEARVMPFRRKIR